MGTNIPDNYLEEPPDELDYTTEEWRDLNYNQQYYRANKDRRDYIKQQSRKNKQRNRDWIKLVKEEAQCRSCGEERWQALDFHHIEDKKMSISRMASYEYGIGSIAEEMEKCVILCANCHRVHHDGGLEKDIKSLETGSNLSKEVLNQNI